MNLVPLLNNLKVIFKIVFTLGFLFTFILTIYLLTSKEYVSALNTGIITGIFVWVSKFDFK